jgi:DNA-binding NarL/FixJ family response regulator
MQRKILLLLGAGHTQASVARQLCIGERTVREHLRLLSNLTGASSNFMLGVEATRRGWLDTI